MYIGKLLLHVCKFSAIMEGMKESVHSQPGVGPIIRQRRQALGWTQPELARRSRIDTAVVHRIESGAIARPVPNKLARLADALGLPAADLYALAGYAAPLELPSFRPYLRAKYGQLPPKAIEQLEAYFDKVAGPYGTPGNGPADGEDEQTE